MKNENKELTVKIDLSPEEIAYLKQFGNNIPNEAIRKVLIHREIRLRT